MSIPAQNSPNVQVLGLPMNQYGYDNRTPYANGAAGSVVPMNVFVSDVRTCTTQANFWSVFMKEGESSPLCYVKRPGGRGAQVTIRAMGTLGGVGQRGDNLFTSRTQMGKLPMHDINIYLDQRSQATGVTRLVEEMLGTSGQIESSLPGQLGKWGGRAIAQEIDMTLMHQCAANSRMIANFKSSVAVLKSADTPSWNMVRDISATMRSQGGTPFMTGKKANGEPLWNMGFFLPDPIKNPLKNDSTYNQILRDAGIRGDTNPLFAGAIPDIDGNMVFSRYTPVEQGQVKTGTPFNPIAYLGVNQLYQTDGSATTLTGGGALYDGTTDTPWYDDFPGNLYSFMGAGVAFTLAGSFWGAAPYYALIVNPLNSATNPGKIGMIQYTVPAGANVLTIVKRLSDGSSTGHNTGQNADTVGSVSYGGLLGASNFTQDYYAGATIIPCNALGTPIGAICAMGSNALGFCRGTDWGDLYRQKVQGGGAGEEIYSYWTYGLTPYSLPNNMTPGVMVAACAAYYPHLNLPAVT